MLGKRFWALMTEQVEALGARLNSEEPITKVIYRDRYLASPLNVKLLIETLKGLVTLCGGFKPEVKILIETIDSVRTSHRLPELIRDDWTLRRHRNEVIVAMINGLGGTCELIESPRYRAQHVRELIIEWDDGATWTVRLDHGLGFLRSKSMINFDFNAEPLQQWQALSKLNFPIKNSMDQGSHFYLTDVQI
jgi:DEAD/DEAH box helicase domain-containing protein